ncbi:MAG: Crp/Fnr family transcriptional regulator [Alphaproteobacteria bacterium]|nr:Crp/Fnr family transcriptional regulator [Alphaproteobacteria bacterium]MBU1514315.1 Crp/Fnr family transcriptional regulator [Alphaproteobacteria bacterium]MBU2095959.1 Crp/Fnr family transcriptional regulator [Alphaproteobacteria bacterium]MBU2153057.1 Crp/Fnr family transcriptional regulator [Alphaproteobacteria bacterium]MBU2308514.1 Crp/Fnr family transcriptional regulator [Alphaproteobacteria bacterium]
MQRPVPLAQNSLLEALPPSDYAFVAPHLVQIELERGRLLFDPGDPIDQIYFPHDGVISLMTLMENGAAIESATIGPEGALGLMAAVAPRQALSRAIVQTPLRAARIGAERLHEVWEKSPALRDLVDRHTEALYGHAIQSVACNALHSVEARFCRWLLTCHDRISTDTVALTQEFLADMLGVQRTTVTAVARSLQEKGVIRYRRGVVDIVDRQALKALTCECYGVIRNTYKRLLGT